MRIWIFLSLLIVGCATVHTDQPVLEQSKPFLAYNGSRERVQILQLAIPPDIATSYPQLQERRVAQGLYTHLQEELFQCGRFQLLENQEQVQEALLNQWALSQTGILAEAPVSNIPGLQAPDYLLYAQIADVSTGRDEQVQGAHSTQQVHTRVSIQLRLVRVENGQMTPSLGTGEITTTGDAWFLNPTMLFDQTTVGSATQQAIQNALYQLLQRLPNPGIP